MAKVNSCTVLSHQILMFLHIFFLSYILKTTQQHQQQLQQQKEHWL